MKTRLMIIGGALIASLFSLPAMAQPAPSQGMNPNMGQGMGPGMAPGMGPGMAPGMGPGMGMAGYGPGYGPRQGHAARLHANTEPASLLGAPASP